MLNHPGEDIVLQPDFLIMIERVDICLEYLQNHVCLKLKSHREMLTLISENIGKQISMFFGFNNVSPAQ